MVDGTTSVSLSLGGRTVSEMKVCPGLPASSGRSHWVRCTWFWAWALTGAAGAIGLISLGPIALVPAFIAGVVMSRSRTGSRPALGLPVGAGLLSLFIAYVQRDGPGTTCWHTASASGCDQHLNPSLWLIVGIVLVVGGLIAQSRHMG
jgi:hypothetical protein